MTDELDFSAEEFAAMSIPKRIRICRLLAERTRKIAALSDSGQRAGYFRIAEEWDRLAGEIERLE